MRKPAFCLHCDDGTLLWHGARDVTETIDGQSATVHAVRGWHCRVCGEIEFEQGTGEAERYNAALVALRESVTARRAAQLRAIRKKLGLKQAEAGRMFGGGINAFSEYERGKTQPHKSTVLLFQLLDKHPDLLAELRTSAFV